MEACAYWGCRKKEGLSCTRMLGKEEITRTHPPKSTQGIGSPRHVLHVHLQTHTLHEYSDGAPARVNTKR